jgi:hypothetical protein
MALTPNTFSQLVNFARTSAGQRVSEASIYEAVAAGYPRNDYEPTPNLVSNGDFVSGVAGWTAYNGAVLTAAPGQMVLSANGERGYPGASTALTGLVVNKKYYVRAAYVHADGSGFAFVSAVSGGTVRLGSSAVRTTSGILEFSFVATATTLYLNLEQGITAPGSVATAGFGAVSVREVKERGMLIEEARTNLIGNSAYWQPAGGGPVYPSYIVDQIAPDGTASASRVAIPGNRHFIEYYQLLNAATTFSVYVKTVSGTAAMTLALKDAVSDTIRASTNFTATTDWQRVSVSGTPAGSTAGCRIEMAGYAAGVVYWGAQLEAGLFPTSYIPTPATFTSRAGSASYFDADGLLKLAGGNLLTNSNALTTWDNTNGASLTANYAVSPDGATNATRLVASAADCYVSRWVTLGVGTYTLSMYVKAVTPNRVAMLWGYMAGTAVGTTTNPRVAVPTDSYIRLSCTFIITTAGTVLLRLDPNEGANGENGAVGDEFYIYGMQLEYGSNMTAYQATTTAAIAPAARIGYDPATRISQGLVLENAATNLLTGSDRLDRWGTFNSSTVFNGTHAAPDGTMSAVTLRNVQNNAGGRVQGVTITGAAVGAKYTFSIWAKLKNASNGKSVWLVARLLGGANGAGDTISVSLLTDAWQRFSITTTVDYADRTTLYAIVGNGNDAGNGPTSIPGQEIVVWGPQLEAGSVATSYIPTRTQFTGRASTGTYFDRDGRMQLASVGAPRYDFDPATLKGGELLLEGAATNLLAYGDNPERGWSYGAIKPVPYYALAPNGTMTASRVSGLAPNNLYRQPAASASTAYVFSAYLKADTSTSVIFGIEGQGLYTIDLSAGATASSNAGMTCVITPVGSGWYRVAVGYTTPAGATVSTLHIASAGCLVWGIQWETGAVATSLVPTPTVFTSRDSLGTYFDANGVMQTAKSRNLTPRSEEFDVAPWYKVNAGVAANTASAPDGTLSADLLTDNSTNGFHVLYQDGNTNVAVSAAYTYSVYLKAGTRTWAVVTVNLANGGTTNDVGTSVNLATGTLGAAWGSPTGRSITNVGNGWYRVTVTALSTAAATFPPHVWVAKGDSTGRTDPNVSYIGDGSGIFAWGAQTEAGSTAGDYARTTSAASFAPRIDYAPDEYALQNMWLNSQEMSGGSAQNLTVSSDVIAAPDGSMTGDRLTAGDVNQPRIEFNAGLKSGQTYNFSVYVKAGSATHASLGGYWAIPGFDGGATTNKWALFNLATGTVVSAHAAMSNVRITSVSNGWYRISMAMQNTSGGSNWKLAIASASGPDTAVLGSTLFACGVQFSKGDSLLPYTKTTSSTVAVRASRGLLVESAATNMFDYSGPLTTNWFGNGGTYAANFGTAPDGTTSSTQWSLANANEGKYRTVSAMVEGTTYAISMYVKRTSGAGQLRLGFESPAQWAAFDLLTMSVASAPSSAVAAVQSVGNGWYRLSITSTLLSGSTKVIIAYAANINAAPLVFEAWGAQLEQVSQSLGSELVTNGTFVQDLTGWTAANGATTALSNSAIRVTADGVTAYPSARQTITGLTVGKQYTISASAPALSAGNTLGAFGIVSLADYTGISGTGTQTKTFVATATSHMVYVGMNGTPAAGAWFEWDNISVKETAGVELVTNGTFDTNTTGWAAIGTGGSIAAVSGELQLTGSGGAYPGARYNVTGLTAGKQYTATATMRQGTTTSPVTVTFGTAAAAGVSTTTATARSVTFTATGASATFDFNISSATATGTAFIDNVSVRDAQNLVWNGTFDVDASNWSAAYQSTLSAVGGKLRVTSAGGNPYATQGLTVTPGRTYRLSIDAYTRSDTTVWSVYLGSTAGLFQTQLGAIPLATGQATTVTFVATTSVFNIQLSSNAPTGQYADFDNIVLTDVTELVSNGAFEGMNTGWSQSTKYPSLASCVSGELQISNAVQYGRQLTPVACTVGKTYAVSGAIRVVSGSGAQAEMTLAGADGATVSVLAATSATSATTLAGAFVATATTHYIAIGVGNSVVNAVIGADNVTVKEVAGTSGVTSYIPTTTAAVTRAADSVTSATATRAADSSVANTASRAADVYSAPTVARAVESASVVSLAPWFAPASWTILVEFIMPPVHNWPGVFSLRRNSGAQHRVCAYLAGSSICARVDNEGVIELDNPTGATAAPGDRVKLALTKVGGRIAASSKGVTPVTLTTAIDCSKLTSLDLGKVDSLLNSSLVNFQFYPYGMTDAQLQALTA